MASMRWIDSENFRLLPYFNLELKFNSREYLEHLIKEYPNKSVIEALKIDNAWTP